MTSYPDWFCWMHEGVRYLHCPYADDLEIWRVEWHVEDGERTVLVHKDDPDWPGAVLSLTASHPLYRKDES